MASLGDHIGPDVPAHLFSKFISLYAMDFCGRAAAAVAAGSRSASQIRDLTIG
jgi:hypothetical protein